MLFGCEIAAFQAKQEKIQLKKRSIYKVSIRKRQDIV
jgi:hypothetical protein